MTAAANLNHSSTMARPADYSFGSPDSGLGGQRTFKKHKVLPHPKRRAENTRSYDDRSAPRKHDLLINSLPSQMDAPQRTGSQTLRHQSRRISSGPDLPPTPPSHSRTSSSSHSIPTPSPAPDETASQTPTTPTRALATPPNQKSPPTPDVTPPQPVTRPKVVRPIPMDRTVSKATTAESRAESFRTAREDPYSSEEVDEEDLQSTVRPDVLSARTSQNTVRRVSESKAKTPPPVGLGLGLESPPEDVPTPKAKGDFAAFDGEWVLDKEVEQEWDDNLGRSVTIRKRRRKEPEKASETGHENPVRRRGPRRKVEIVEDRVVTPTNAAKAVRAMSRHDRAAFYAPSEIAWQNRSTSETSVNADSRRLSGMSAKSTRSNASTIVEAILVDAPAIPQRRQTLRHVRKQVRRFAETLKAVGPPHGKSQQQLRVEHDIQLDLERQGSSGNLEERRYSSGSGPGSPIVKVKQGAVAQVYQQSPIQAKREFEFDNSC